MKKTQSLLLALALSLAWAVEATSGVYKTLDQVLSEVFPGGFDRKTAFLSDEQVRDVERQSRTRVESKILTYYIGRTADGKPAGTAFFDTHIVRTTTEVLFVWIDTEGKVVRSEILAFHEPEDYKVRQSWLDRLDGKDREDEVTVGRDLNGVTGATLTVRALSGAVRRVLALHHLLSGEN